MFLEVGAMGVFVMIYLPLVVRVLCCALFSSESRLLTVLFNTLGRISDGKCYICSVLYIIWSFVERH